VAELKQHNGLLTEAATERATKLHECEDKLTRVEAELAAVARENEHIRAKHASTFGRAEKLEGSHD